MINNNKYIEEYVVKLTCKTFTKITCKTKDINPKLLCK